VKPNIVAEPVSTQILFSVKQRMRCSSLADLSLIHSLNHLLFVFLQVYMLLLGVTARSLLTTPFVIAAVINLLIKPVVSVVGAAGVHAAASCSSYRHPLITCAGAKLEHITCS
jgi:hypothetical protein